MLLANKLKESGPLLQELENSFPIKGEKALLLQFIFYDTSLLIKEIHSNHTKERFMIFIETIVSSIYINRFYLYSRIINMVPNKNIINYAKQSH